MEMFTPTDYLESTFGSGARLWKVICIAKPYRSQIETQQIVLQVYKGPSGIVREQQTASRFVFKCATSACRLRKKLC